MATAATAKKRPDMGAARAEISRLTTYSWEALDKRGQKMRGEMPSKNASLVKAELRRQGMNPQKVKEKAKPLFGAAGSSIKPRDISIFSRQIATMMKSGVPMVQAFEIIAGGQRNVRMKNLLIDIKTSLEGGISLHEALARHPVQFDELYCNLVKAGEAAGVLDTVLDTVATYKERMEAMKSKIKKAMFYPAMVFSVAIIVSLVLLIFVVPVFSKVFKDAGAAMPAFTQMIINASDFVKNNGIFILLVLVATIVGLVMLYKRSTAFAQNLDRLSLKLPIIGNILRESAIARFARTLGVTFKAGVPLVEALDAVAGATGSVVYGNAVRKMREDISVGHKLELAMRQTDLFPNMVVQMTAIGEESGALDTMLYKIAEFYEEEVNNAVDTLSTLLEPLIMVVIGILVGGMVIGLYLPIFKLAGTF
ncbi:type II secretion system F family protein [Metallibacterium sp.]|uniref:type II secretion system F family protein n=1 Tax=Metallibacterium sp. TaxID=2940281 RepID=UPI002633527B|nr:type II secretion system F family protein [Metallibacterium sp.]